MFWWPLSRSSSLSAVESVELRQDGSLVSYPVAGHEELRNYYIHAREIKSELKVHFVNSEIQAVSSGESGRDWTFDGQWQGMRIDGWAGGATSKQCVVSRFRKPQFSSRPSMSTQTSFPVYRQHKVARTPPRKAFIAFRGEEPGPSILLKPTHPRRNKRVAFKEGHGMRVFQPDNHHTKKILMAAPEVNIFYNASGRESPGNNSTFLDDVASAIREKSRNTLLKLLQSGDLRTDQVIESGKLFLNEQYKLAKVNKHEDVLSVLRVYRAASNAINRSFRAKTGHRIRIRIEKLAGLSLTNEGKKEPNLKTIICRVFNVNKGMKARHLDPTRPMNFAKEIEFGSGSATLPEYNIESYPGKFFSFSLYRNRKRIRTQSIHNIAALSR